MNNDLEKKWREEFEELIKTEYAEKNAYVLVLDKDIDDSYLRSWMNAKWGGYLAARKAAQIEKENQFNSMDYLIKKHAAIIETRNAQLKDRDQEISKLKAEIVEVRGYNCDLANENRKLQEQCEILIENADCRGDEDCDHCEAVRVCKPCQLEIEIIEGMKKELKSLEQEISKLRSVNDSLILSNNSLIEQRDRLNEKNDPLEQEIERMKLDVKHGCSICATQPEVTITYLEEQLKEREEMIKELRSLGTCDIDCDGMKCSKTCKKKSMIFEKARKMVGEK